MPEMLLKPRISEKAIGSAETGAYVFDVPLASNKAEVAAAIERQFKVKVVAVNIAIHKGKLKRFGRRFGRQNDTKKAMVRLEKGQTIKLFEGAK